jgi:hypothetical protein
VNESANEHVVQIRRRVELEGTSVDEAWGLVTEPGEMAGWMGGEVDLDLSPGAVGVIVDDEGLERRVVVQDLEPGRLRFTWWPDDDPGAASTVEITVVESPAGTAAIEVVETLVMAGPAAVAKAERFWGWCAAALVGANAVTARARA